MSKLLTPKQVGQQLHVSTSTLRNWRLKGIGPSVIQLGPAVFRYEEKAVEEYISQSVTEKQRWPE